MALVPRRREQVPAHAKTGDGSLGQLTVRHASATHPLLLATRPRLKPPACSEEGRCRSVSLGDGEIVHVDLVHRCSRARPDLSRHGMIAEVAPFEREDAKLRRLAFEDSLSVVGVDHSVLDLPISGFPLNRKPREERPVPRSDENRDLRLNVLLRTLAVIPSLPALEAPAIGWIKLEDVTAEDYLTAFGLRLHFRRGEAIDNWSSVR